MCVYNVPPDTPVPAAEVLIDLKGTALQYIYHMSYMVSIIEQFPVYSMDAFSFGSFWRWIRRNHLLLKTVSLEQSFFCLQRSSPAPSMFSLSPEKL